MAVGLNLVMSIIRRISQRLHVDTAPDGSSQPVLQSVRHRPRNADIAVGALSGGNQQKIVLAKEIPGNPQLLLLDEPTRGVDVGAKGEIYAQLRQLASQGLGILVASSEMPELIGLCDRIIVLRKGKRRSSAPASTNIRLAAANGKGDVEQSSATAPVPSAPARHRDPLALIVRFQSLIGLILVILSGIVFSPRRHGTILFLAETIANIVRAVSETGIIAIGMTFVIITAGSTCRWERLAACPAS